MKKNLSLLGILLLVFNCRISAQNFTTTISSPKIGHDLISPMKGPASLQFTVAVKSNDTVAYTVAIDKAGMLPIDTWISIENNSRVLDPGETESYTLTLTIPSNALEQDIPLTINCLATRNGVTNTVLGKILTVIVDNSQPESSECTLVYSTSSKIRVDYNGYDLRSSEYTALNTTSGYNGIKDFTLVLKNSAGSIVKNQSVIATVPRTYVFEGLVSNSLYYTTVNATDLAGNSKTSSILSVTTLPGMVTNASAVAGYCNLNINWDAVPGAIGYSIGFHSDPNRSTTTNTSFSFSGLIPNTTYSFDIQAIGALGWGDTKTISFQTQQISYPSFNSSLKICGVSQLMEVAPINNASSYVWSVPSPLTLEDGGQTCTTSTNSVTVHTNGFLGSTTISVSATTNMHDIN